jgi:hypothetical protein
MKSPTKIITLFLLVFSGAANAQWNTNTISADAPTTCTSGQPIANCPVTGYRIERASSQTGTYAAVGTSPTPSFTHNGASAGLNCYRMVALSAQGESAPSVVTASACKTNVEPSGPPNPPTNLRVTATVAFNVRADFQKFAFVKSTRFGTVKLGAACDESRSVGGGFYAIERPRSQVTPRPQEGVVLVASCA